MDIDDGDWGVRRSAGAPHLLAARCEDAVVAQVVVTKVLVAPGVVSGYHGLEMAHVVGDGIVGSEQDNGGFGRQGQDVAVISFVSPALGDRSGMG